jgi:hypothetical protein
MGFWEDHCPSRASDLTHVHDAKCEDGHLNDQCCECGMRSAMWSQPAPPVVRLVPDIPAGFGKAEAIDEDAPREPGMARREYPKRWRHDWGRMPWGPSDEDRLLFLLALRDAHLGD